MSWLGGLASIQIIKYLTDYSYKTKRRVGSLCCISPSPSISFVRAPLRVIIDFMIIGTSCLRLGWYLQGGERRGDRKPFGHGRSGPTTTSLGGITNRVAGRRCGRRDGICVTACCYWRLVRVSLLLRLCSLPSSPLLSWVPPDYSLLLPLPLLLATLLLPMLAASIVPVLRMLRTTVAPPFCGVLGTTGVLGARVGL